MNTCADRNEVEMFENALYRNILLFNDGRITEREAKLLAEEKTKKIDFNNGYLMHKSFAWFAKTAIDDYLARTTRY